MTISSSTDSAAKLMRREDDPLTRWLYAIYFVAGIPPLIYQVVWQRALGLYFGVDVYSTSLTVATFMGGLGFGSLLGGAAAKRVKRPEALYAVLELGLAVLGAASPAVLTLVGSKLAGASLPTIGLASAALMSLPTLVMGATLPAISQSVVTRDDPDSGRKLASLYGFNTAGAGLGALLAAYFLIGRFGLDGATWIAASLNALLGVFVFALARRVQRAPEATQARASESPPNRMLLFLSMMSGVVALGYELVWYRLLGVLLHGTVYVFGTLLAVYLAGVAGGSVWARRRVDRPNPIGRFGASQILISAYVLAFAELLVHGGTLPGVRHLLAASFFTSFHPTPALRAGAINATALYSLADIPFWATAMLGAPTFLMGFGFPHLLKAATGDREVGTAVGQVYAANIVGSIAGALLVGFVGVGHLGSEITLDILVAVGCGLGALATGASRAEAGSGRRRWLAAAAVLALLALVVGPRAGRLIRAVHAADDPSVYFESREDSGGVVALRRQDKVIAFREETKILGSTKLYIDGVAHGHGDSSSGPEWKTAMALASEPHPRRVLVIGLGDGVTCESILADPEVSEVVVVELNGSLLNLLRTTERGAKISASAKLHYMIEDGRHWLLAHPDEKFDMITTFPLHPAHAGYGNLYSREFLSVMAAHLNPGGILFTDTADAFSTARTIADVFSDVVRIGGNGYIAKLSPLRFSAARLPFGPADITERVDADAATIRAHTQGVPLNRDLHPESEYYLTYPWAAHLLDTAPAYVETDRSRFTALVAP